MKRIDRNILAIDLKSFYASVECLDRGLDPFSTPLVVADESRGDGTIVLAASPFIKEKYHVPSRCRLSEVPKDIPGLIIAMPKMKRYLEVSAKVNDIYLEFVSEADLFVYSIDESFLDVTNYLKRNNDTPKSYAQKIIRQIRARTGLVVTAGIGLNLFMAKACMDVEAKRNKDFLAEWDYSSIPEHLWTVKPLSKMWGIGKQLEKRLNKMGFYTVGDIAVTDPKSLKRKLVAIGTENYYPPSGYADPLLQESYTSQNHSLSAGQVLLRDYEPSEIPVLIQDMVIELSDRMIEEGVTSREFLLYLGDKEHQGFSLKASFFTPTNSFEKVGKDFIQQYLSLIIPKDLLFRTINLIALDVSEEGAYQMSIFENTEEDYRIRKLDKTLLSIRKKYGTEKAMPCSALSFSSTFITRQNQIGGHHA